MGGTQETFGGVLDNLLGGTGQAEAAKLRGAGMISKRCPMEGQKIERMNRKKRMERSGQDVDILKKV